jgi:hypothetical protein
MGGERFLDYWGANMRFAWAMTQGAQWPGFRYSDIERDLLRERAARIGTGRFWAFMAWVTALFILGAGLLVGFVMVPLLGWFWPDAARTPAAGFFGILAAIIALSIGPVFLGALRAGAWLADGFGRARPGADRPATAANAALIAKVRWQFLRMALVLGGLFVPAALIWSTLNAELRAGIVWTLEVVYVLVMLASIGGLVANRRRRG